MASSTGGLAKRAWRLADMGANAVSRRTAE
jgi:hypothetical protein